MILLQRKLYFSKDSEGVQHFPGDPASFGVGGGVQMLISIEPHITCDFPGGPYGWGSPLTLAFQQGGRGHVLIVPIKSLKIFLACFTHSVFTN